MTFKQFRKYLDEEDGGGAGTTSTGQGGGPPDVAGEPPNNPNVALYNKRLRPMKKRKLIPDTFWVTREERNANWIKNRLT